VKGETGPPGPPGPPGPAAVTRVAGAPVLSGDAAARGALVTATAACTSGTSILSGGGTATTDDPSPDKVELVASYPSSSTTWAVTATVNTKLAAGKRFTVTAYAICG
jgi:hypothetical protein